VRSGACYPVPFEEVSCSPIQGQAVAFAVVVLAANRMSCRTGAGEGREGQAAARTEVEAAVSRSVDWAGAEGVDVWPEGAAAQGAVGRMYAPPGAVESLGWGAAEEEAVAQTAAVAVAAGNECRSAGDCPVVRGPWCVGNFVRVVVGNRRVAAVVVERFGLDHAVVRLSEEGLACSEG
jgi:hypothetical protein